MKTVFFPPLRFCQILQRMRSMFSENLKRLLSIKFLLIAACPFPIARHSPQNMVYAALSPAFTVRLPCGSNLPFTMSPVGPSYRCANLAIEPRRRATAPLALVFV
ncbi:MAG: hypothetical protein GEU91_10690 [Rhizobiales bacterium]|nr:hypothetical protein [Hyphomicrobiales bacterium]